jgi:type II secretory pathway component PulC
MMAHQMDLFQASKMIELTPEAIALAVNGTDLDSLANMIVLLESIRTRTRAASPQQTHLRNALESLNMAVGNRRFAVGA